MAAAERRLSISETGESDDDGFDTLLSSLGFGRWQSGSVVMVLIIAGLLPAQMIGVSLLAPPVPFRCHTGLSTSDNVSVLSTNDSLPEVPEAGGINVTYFDEKCFPSLEYAGAKLTAPNQTIVTDLPSCPFIEYDTSIFSSSIVSDYHLVCESFDQQALFQITYNIGGILGSIIGGQIGDRWGRRTAVQLGAVLYLGSVLAMAFVPSYAVILVMRLVVGYAANSALVTGWNMVVEGSPARNRSLVGMLMGLPYSVFIIFFSTAGYFIRKWQNLLLVCSVPVLILIPLSFYVDESPRWLLQQGETKKALAVLQRAVRMNKAKINVDLSSAVEKIVQRNKRLQPSSSEQGASMTSSCKFSLQQVADYLRSPGMRIILIVTPLIWFLQSFVYLGLAINANNFASDNPFLYVGLTGIMDGSSILLSTPATPFLGRRVMIGAEFFTGGVLLLLELIVPAYYSWIKWVLVMVGFLLVAGAFQVNFIYAPELFPTQARARGFALVNTVGSIGFMCAPLITTILAKVSTWAPGIVFGCSGILASMLVPLLPETNKKPLPETLLDVDHRYREGRIKSKASGVDNLAYKHDVKNNASVSTLKISKTSKSGEQE